MPKHYIHSTSNDSYCSSKRTRKPFSSYAKTIQLYFGPSPFYFFNSWILNKEFDSIFEKYWNEFQGYGAPDSYLLAKLKVLKDVLRKWRMDVSHTKSGSLKQLRGTINKIEIEVQSSALTLHEINHQNLELLN